MPDLSHLWQRFLLASSLVVGVVLGVAATVFGYSNLASVNVRWSVFHVDGIPLWTVALVPLAVVLVAGTVYHWMDGLHHFTEHMRHRRRVHELEAEVASLRGRLDQVLDMPDHSTSPLPHTAVVDKLEPMPDTVAEVARPALPQPKPAALPEKSPSKAVATKTPAVKTPPVKTAPDRTVDSNGVKTVHRRAKRATLLVAKTPTPSHTSIATNGGQETAAPESAPEI